MVGALLGGELVIMRPSRVAMCDRATHNARHHQLPVLSMSLYECAQSSGTVIAKSARFPGGFVEGDGLKNRRLRQCNISIPEVLISITLSVRVEVAERLKAAV
jgi:hypothetical protein